MLNVAKQHVKMEHSEKSWLALNCCLSIINTPDNLYMCIISVTYVTKFIIRVYFCLCFSYKLRYLRWRAD